MKYSSIFSMLSFFILFACNETAVYGSDENIIFMRYVEKLHLDKYSVKNTVKTETMAIQLAEIYVRYRYGERIAEEEKPYLITELPYPAHLNRLVCFLRLYKNNVHHF